MAPMPFTSRLWFAWACFFRVLFDGVFAARAQEVASGAVPELPPAKPKAKAKARRDEDEEEDEEDEEEAAKPKAAKPKAAAAKPKAVSTPLPPPPTDAALQLLALLQREGRLVDFLQEDVEGASDVDLGAAARTVHAGCRKALRDHVRLVPVREEEEGTKVSLAEGDVTPDVKLTGNVQGKGPFAGTLRHRGWRAVDVKLPTAVGGHDAHIVAQAEVEL